MSRDVEVHNPATMMCENLQDKQHFVVEDVRMHFTLAFKARSLQWITIVVLVCGVWFTSGKSFAAESGMAVEPLRARYTELSKQLRHNQFQRALYLDSSQSLTDLKGEIYAVVDYPFATVNGALIYVREVVDVDGLNISSWPSSPTACRSRSNSAHAHWRRG
jgi:hypothetical protein